MHVVLGQSSGAVGGVLVWMGLLVALTIAGGVVMIAVRKRALSRDDPTADAGGLMDSLKAARDAGDLTDEEFRAARLRLLGMDTGDAPSAPGVPPRVTQMSDVGGDAGGNAGTRKKPDTSGGLRARPGYDLTGDPLPPVPPDDRPPA